ncbi:DNA repair protein complementing XP-C cells homolog [Topomyia yanbarensis]|uniref:DNA repair protein complementing XP-C cells homolog n=1 Tax=Topomyia yanbarensis TaxID=2498891 RepID=UPI00273C12D4|nr:DNA repair protein complementing XP-C cells homolog [Topomyia yanbarensis]
MESDPSASEESPSEFSASEDEWSPPKECSKPVKSKARSVSKCKAKPERAKKLEPSEKLARPTRVSRRIAHRLGKSIPEEDETVNLLEDESLASDTSEEKPKKKKKSPAKRGRKPVLVAKEEPIKLTTFTVEQLYRKYRPDLAGPSKKCVIEKKRSKPEDDDSSGDDYLLDPAEIDLDSEFFKPIAADENRKSAAGFDCTVGLPSDQSDVDDDTMPLSSEINWQLIKQINLANISCFDKPKLGETSKPTEQNQETNRKSIASEEHDVSNLLLTGEKIGTKKMPPSSGRHDFLSVVGRKDKEEEKVVEFTVKVDSAEQSKPQKKKLDLLTAIKRLMNREKRQNQIYLHKVSILCWIAHGTFLNKTLADPRLTQEIAKRLLPSTNCRPKGRTNLLYFEQVTRYFRKCVQLKSNQWCYRSAKLPPLYTTIKFQILQRSAFSKRDYVLLFLLMLRTLSIHSRLVISLVVPPKQVPNSELYRMNSQSPEDVQADRRLLLEFQRAPKHSTIFKVKEKLTTTVKKNADQIRRDASKKRRHGGFMATIPQLDGSNDTVKSRPSEAKRKKLKLMNESFLDIEHNTPANVFRKPQKEDKQFSDELDEVVRRRREKILAAYRASKEQKAIGVVADEDDLYGEGSSSSLHVGRLGGVAHRKARRNLPGVDLWVEVYCEHEDKWITIDVLTGKVHCLEDIVNCATQPIYYVLAWNNDGTVKDVSPRYISRLGSKKSKLRVEDSWLETALSRYRISRATRRDRSEDLKFDKLLNKRPFPVQIGEYKNHPRFAIERHLLRSEAIYPRDAVILGYIKGEPIYPRDCVHVLFSREGWLRQAKTVRMHEEPYKVVKAKARYDRLTGTPIGALQTELFGAWQVQDYEPPVAENGIVPRSAYGNVGLFKPCMLPKGCVHLQLPGLNKVCKRLRVDCASAIIGFEFKNGACHAVYDGFVVCEEFRDQVIDEWYQEQVELERKQDEKYKKRVYGNWKKLITGLFIRKKLKDRYNFDNL